jgi:hypothetical protein
MYNVIISIAGGNYFTRINFSNQDNTCYLKPKNLTWDTYPSKI